METKIKEILEVAQDTVSNHQRNILKLEKIYNETDFEAFTTILFRCIKHVFLLEQNTYKVYVERILDFLGKFISAVAEKYEKVHEEDLDESIPSEPLLSYMITNVLMCHNNIDTRIRYHSCKLIGKIIVHLRCDLSEDFYNMIQDAMLERLKDSKPIVRIQAIKALERLQQPHDPNCQVIKAFIAVFADSSPQVRKEIVRHLAPSQRHKETILYIEERTRDTDADVRMVAFQRCSDISPKCFRIVSRQHILMSGFKDANKNVQKVFTGRLLPKWLTTFNSNFLEFMRAIKLDADENDILNTQVICEKMMEAFFKTHPIQDFIDVLPAENKLIPLENLTSEVVLYWSILTNYLRDIEDAEEYLQDILPELTPFCNYIEMVIKTKSSKIMEKWEFLDYQHTVLVLFEMVEKYDFSDELGRKTLKALILNIMQNHQFEYRVLCVLMRLSTKLITDVGTFTTEMCQVISEIREPLVEKSVETVHNPDYAVKLARLQNRLYILEGNKEDAIEKQDYKKAQELHDEIQAVHREIDELTLPESQGTQKVRESKMDAGTICRCLDILAAVLQTATVTNVTPSLQTVRNEFLMPLMTSMIEEVNWRVLRCLTLYCCIDKDLAEENAKFVPIPIAAYHSDYNRQALVTSIAGFTDLIRLYGPDLFANNEPTLNKNTTRGRVLYRDEEAVEELASIETNLGWDHIVEIILDMLDDESEEIKDAAFIAIAKLVLNRFPVSSTLMSRLILKWYNPSSGFMDKRKHEKHQRISSNEKSEDKLQQRIGWMIDEYSKKIKGSKEVIEQAVIPTLKTIANAPSTSPLADIDVDNVIKFFSVLTSGGNGVVHIHGSLAESICHEIVSKPLESVVPYLTKMLRNLEPPPNESTRSELIKLAEKLLQEEYGLEKSSRKHVMQFITALSNYKQNSDIGTTTVATSLNTTVNSAARNGETTTVNTTMNSVNDNGAPTSLNTTLNSVVKNGATASLNTTLNSTVHNGERSSLNTTVNSAVHNGAKQNKNPVVQSGARKSLNTRRSTVNGARMSLLPAIQENDAEDVQNNSNSTESSTSSRRRSLRKKPRLDVQAEKTTASNKEKVSTTEKHDTPVRTTKRNKKRQRKEYSPVSESEPNTSFVSTRSKRSQASGSSPLTDVSIISATSSSKSGSQPENTSLRRSVRSRKNPLKVR